MSKAKDDKATAFQDRKAVPNTPGHVARFYGVIPRYVAGGHQSASKKHGKRGWK